MRKDDKRLITYLLFGYKRIGLSEHRSSQVGKGKAMEIEAIGNTMIQPMLI